MAAILKIVKSPYLTEILSDFDAVWYTAANVEPDYSHVTKNWNFKIQDGGVRHLENRFFGNYSSTDCPISAKFRMRKQNACQQGLHEKICIFFKSKMADGRHFENR